MSFLSAVLNSISKGENSTPFPSSSSRIPPAPKPATIGVKRKAETELERPENKAQRTGDTNVTRDIKPLPQRADRPSGSAPGVKTAPGGVRAGNAGQQNGARIDKAPVATGVATGGKLATGPKPAITSKAASGASMKPGSSTDPRRAVQPSKPSVSSATASATQTSQPKKGSFKDLMQRAKAAQTVAVGKILHKPAERLGKKERMLLNKGKPVRGKEPLAAPTKAAGKQSAGKDGKAQKPAPVAATGSKYQGTSKPKISARSSYQGTAKPVAKPAYRGTSKSNASAPSSRNTKPERRADRNEYLGTDEEDEGEYGYDSEGQYTENSEDFSDMDAGFDEIGDEEEEAERQAKMDDIKEQRLLDKLAREKALKKRGR